jgi:hypothetical protein
VRHRDIERETEKESEREERESEEEGGREKDPGATIFPSRPRPQ